MPVTLASLNSCGSDLARYNAAGTTVNFSDTPDLAAPIRPLALRAGWVIHVLAAYACGYGGAVIGRAEAIGALRRKAPIYCGGVTSPW